MKPNRRFAKRRPCQRRRSLDYPGTAMRDFQSRAHAARAPPGTALAPARHARLQRRSPHRGAASGRERRRRESALLTSTTTSLPNMRAARDKPHVRPHPRARTKPFAERHASYRRVSCIGCLSFSDFRFPDLPPSRPVLHGEASRPAEPRALKAKTHKLPCGNVAWDPLSTALGFIVS